MVCLLSLEYTVTGQTSEKNSNWSFKYSSPLHRAQKLEVCVVQSPCVYSLWFEWRMAVKSVQHGAGWMPVSPARICGHTQGFVPASSVLRPRWPNRIHTIQSRRKTHRKLPARFATAAFLCHQVQRLKEHGVSLPCSHIKVRHVPPQRRAPNQETGIKSFWPRFLVCVQSPGTAVFMYCSMRARQHVTWQHHSRVLSSSKPVEIFNCLFVCRECKHPTPELTALVLGA